MEGLKAYRQRILFRMKVLCYLTSESVFGRKQEFPQLDKLCGVVVRIRKRDHVEESKHLLIAMLEDLLAEEEVEKKKKKLVEKYNMVMDVELERSVSQMCNISEYMSEEFRKEGLEEGLKQGLKQGIEQGIEQGKIQLVKEVLVETLDEKGVMSDLLSEKIAEQSDIDVLKSWVHLALRTDSPEQFMANM